MYYARYVQEETEAQSSTQAEGGRARTQPGQVPWEACPRAELAAPGLATPWDGAHTLDTQPAPSVQPPATLPTFLCPPQENQESDEILSSKPLPHPHFKAIVST